MISGIEKTRIAAAIRDAETRTAGEVLCVVARHCSDYRLAPIAWAALLALLIPMPLIYLTAWDPEPIYAFQLVAFLFSSVGLSHPALRFHVVPRRIKHDRAHAEATRQFVVQGLAQTEHRTGVLIFASAAERYAEIIADAGINEKVTPEVWDETVTALVSAIKAGRTADGFVAAVERCGAVLALHFPPGALKRDELPNRIVEI